MLEETANDDASGRPSFSLLNLNVLRELDALQDHFTAATAIWLEFSSSGCREAFTSPAALPCGYSFSYQPSLLSLRYPTQLFQTVILGAARSGAERREHGVAKEDGMWAGYMLRKWYSVVRYGMDCINRYLSDCRFQCVFCSLHQNEQNEENRVQELCHLCIVVDDCVVCHRSVTMHFVLESIWFGASVRVRCKADTQRSGILDGRTLPDWKVTYDESRCLMKDDSSPSISLDKDVYNRFEVSKYVSRQVL